MTEEVRRSVAAVVQSLDIEAEGRTAFGPFEPPTETSAERQASAALRPTQRLPRWPFFAVLLAGLGWLWIDERLRN